MNAEHIREWALVQTPALSDGPSGRQLLLVISTAHPHYYGPIPSPIYLLVLCPNLLAFLLPSPSPSNLVPPCGLVQPLIWALLGQVQLHVATSALLTLRSPKAGIANILFYPSLSAPKDSASRYRCGVSSPSPVTKSFYHLVMYLAANIRRTSKL